MNVKYLNQKETIKIRKIDYERLVKKAEEMELDIQDVIEWLVSECLDELQ